MKHAPARCQIVPGVPRARLQGWLIVVPYLFASAETGRASAGSAEWRPRCCWPGGLRGRCPWLSVDSGRYTCYGTDI
jgi:hypothetical protein